MSKVMLFHKMIFPWLLTSSHLAPTDCTDPAPEHEVHPAHHRSGSCERKPPLQQTLNNPAHDIENAFTFHLIISAPCETFAMYASQVRKGRTWMKRIEKGSWRGCQFLNPCLFTQLSSIGLQRPQFALFISFLSLTELLACKTCHYIAE